RPGINNIINIYGTVKPVTVYAGAGNDTITVGNGHLDTVNVPLTINGGSGDTLNVNDTLASGCPNYTSTVTDTSRGRFMVDYAPLFVLNYNGTLFHLDGGSCGVLGFTSQSTDLSFLEHSFHTGSGPWTIHVGASPNWLNFRGALDFSSQGT